MKYIFLHDPEYKTNLLYVLLNDVYPENIELKAYCLMMFIRKVSH